MAEPPANPDHLRSELHFLASYFAQFLDRASRLSADAGFVETLSTGSMAGHPNVVAYAHNFDIEEALSLLVPMTWPDEDCTPPAAFDAIKQAIVDVVIRWGWNPDTLGESRSFGPDDPAALLTSEEYSRISALLRSLEWYIFTLPRRDDGAHEPAPIRTALDGLVAEDPNQPDRCFFTPLFFRTLRLFDEEGLDQIKQALDDLKGSPEAQGVFRNYVFRNGFGIGRSGVHPEPQRLAEIVKRLSTFLRVAEFTIPIEDDPERMERPFGVNWVDAEYYACEAASALCDVVDGEEFEHGPDSVAFAFGWSPEINFALRCLDSQLHTLLTEWKAHEWEQRLVQGGAVPSHPVTIRTGELAGLSRTLETLEAGLEQLGLVPDPAADRSEPTVKRAKRDPAKRFKIIETYHNHRDWSYGQIAEATGADRGHVCRLLKPLRDRDRAEAEGRMPRGYKDGTGQFEGWAEKPCP